MGNRRDVIRGRIRALLNQAADRAGTPEGEIFEAKALELLARYGLTESDLPEAGDADPHEVVERTIDVTGRYVTQRLALLGSLARALHCASAARKLGGTGRRAILVGARRHVDRLDLLWPMLDAHMAGRAVQLRSEVGDPAETARLRRSFMVGFSRGIAARLREVEHAVAEEHGPGTGLALLDDGRRAEAEMARRYSVRAGRASTAEMDPAALGDGVRAAGSVDLGARRMEPRKAIGG
ncbi:DUF2786 domain-containing protein [Corynebacterium sp. 335C]